MPTSMSGPILHEDAPEVVSKDAFEMLEGMAATTSICNAGGVLLSNNACTARFSPQDSSVVMDRISKRALYNAEIGTVKQHCLENDSNEELFACLLRTMQDDSFQSSLVSTLRGSDVCGIAASSSSGATNDAKVVPQIVDVPRVVPLPLTVWRFKTGLTNLTTECIKRMYDRGIFCPKDNVVYTVAWPRF